MAGDRASRRQAYHALNLRFHDLLVDFAGNARLTESYRLLTKGLLLFRLRGLQGRRRICGFQYRAQSGGGRHRRTRRPPGPGSCCAGTRHESRARMHKAAASDVTKIQPE